MLRVENVNKSYQIRDDKKQEVLRDLSVTFQETGFVSILGSSGNGKTTLLNILGGLDTKDSGTIYYKGNVVEDYQTFRKEKIGFVFQEHNLIEHLTIVDNVVLSMPDSLDNKVEKAIEILSELGLQEHIHKKPNQLSGGQKQRVSIARMIAKDVKIIICDEPTGSLDKKIEATITTIIKELSKDRLVLFVTHNRSLAETYSDRVIEIEDGVIYKDTGEYSHAEAKENSTRVTYVKKHFWLAKKNIFGRKKETFKNLAFTFIIMFLATVSIVLNSGAFKDYMHEIRIENGIKNLLLDYDNGVDYASVFNQVEHTNNIEYATDIYDFELEVARFDFLDSRITTFATIENITGNEYIKQSVIYGTYPENPNEVLMGATGAITLLAELEIGGERLQDQFLTGEMDHEYVYSLIDDKEFVIKDGEFPRIKIVGLIDDVRIYEEGMIIYHLDDFYDIIQFDDTMEPTQIKVYKNALYDIDNSAVSLDLSNIDGVKINENHEHIVSVEYNKISSFLHFAKIGLYTIIVISSITFISLLFNTLNERKYEIGLYRSIGYKPSSIMKILGIETIISGMISASIVFILLVVFAFSMYIMPYNELSFYQIILNLNIFMIILSIVVITFVATIFVIYITNIRNLRKTIISNITDF